MGEHGCLCLSSLCPPSSGASQSSSRSTQTDPSGSSVALDALVLPDPRIVPRPSSSSKRRSHRSDAAKVRDSSRKPPGPEPSCLSSAAIDCSCEAQRPSTRSVYQGHWSKWVSWCQKHSVRPLNPSSVDFATILLMLPQPIRFQPITSEFVEPPLHPLWLLQASPKACVHLLSLMSSRVLRPRSLVLVSILLPGTSGLC